MTIPNPTNKTLLPHAADLGVAMPLTMNIDAVVSSAARCRAIRQDSVCSSDTSLVVRKKIHYTTMTKPTTIPYEEENFRFYYFSKEWLLQVK